jgi:hypothetical protein
MPSPNATTYADGRTTAVAVCPLPAIWITGGHARLVGPVTGLQPQSDTQKFHVEKKADGRTPQTFQFRLLEFYFFDHIP